MDFIERWLHVSPDGGSGALEALFVVGLPILIVLAFRRSYFLSLLKWYADRLRRRED